VGEVNTIQFMPYGDLLMDAYGGLDGFLGFTAYFMVLAADSELEALGSATPLFPARRDFIRMVSQANNHSLLPNAGSSTYDLQTFMWPWVAKVRAQMSASGFEPTAPVVDTLDQYGFMDPSDGWTKGPQLLGAPAAVGTQDLGDFDVFMKGASVIGAQTAAGWFALDAPPGAVFVTGSNLTLLTISMAYDY
jgi:hypothetical protein